MFDIGFAELLLLAIVALVVIGPERLPETARTLGLWMGRLRRMFSNAKTELERELGVDEVRRQLHNEQVMSELRAFEKDIGGAGSSPELGNSPELNNSPEPEKSAEHNKSLEPNSIPESNDHAEPSLNPDDAGPVAEQGSPADNQTSNKTGGTD